MMNKRFSLFFKRILGLSTGLFIGSATLNAQVSFGGLPATFEAPSSQLRGELAPNVVSVLPDFNPDDVLAQNQWTVNEVHTKPLIIGKVINADIDFSRQAKRAVMEDGRTIYRLRIETKGAKGIYLTYRNFFIPKDGGELFIYSPDRKTVLGSYTYNTNPKGGEFATEPIANNSIILEYVCPIGRETLPSIKIDGVVYIFRSGVIATEPNLVETRDFDDPGEDNVANPDCSVNVNCPDGNEWQKEKNGVVQMIMLFSDGASGLCTGNLLNNTNEDFTPYIISAAHCLTSKKTFRISEANFSKWVFSFHYEKPGCSSAGFAGTKVKTMIGCTPKAFCPINGQSDGLLLKLNKDIPVAYRVYYNGWDRIKKLPTKVVGMHHPAGDAKKISISDGPFQYSTWNGQVTGGRNDHFIFTFDNKSNTEGGSSGSSLWNQDHLVVATLSGGSAGCQGYNLYGMLSSHWNKYSSTPDYDGAVKSHMDIFLDPKGNGKANKIEGTWRENAKLLVGVKNVKVTSDKEKKNVIVSWDPIDKSQYPSHWTIKYLIYRNGQRIKGADTESNTFTESIEDAGISQEGGAVYYGVQARYLYGGDKLPDDGYNRGLEYVYDDAEIITNGFINSGFIKNVTPEVNSARQGVTISWSSPTNLQEISNFGYPENISSLVSDAPLPLSYNFTLKRPTPDQRTVVASKYHVEGFGEDSKVYVYAVKVMPMSTNSNYDYRLFILSGSKSRSKIHQQVFTIPSNYKSGEWLTVKLENPFRIDPKATTFIGISVPNKNNSDGLKMVTSKGLERKYREFQISGDYGAVFRSGGLYGPKYSYENQGYLAIRPIFSSSTSKPKSDTDVKIVSYSDRPVPFPNIKGYNIYRNGQKVNDKLITYNLFNDANGSTSDSYTIEVIYDKDYFLNNLEVSANELPKIYPTHLVDGRMNIDRVDQVLRLSVYSVDGSLVLQTEKPDSTVDMQTLPEGCYIVVMETSTQKITEKIYR